MKNQQRDMGLCFPKIPLFHIKPIISPFHIKCDELACASIGPKKWVFLFFKMSGRFVMLLNIFMGAPQMSTGAHVMVSASPCVWWRRLGSSSAPPVFTIQNERTIDPMVRFIRMDHKVGLTICFGALVLTTT